MKKKSLELLNINVVDSEIVVSNNDPITEIFPSEESNADSIIENKSNDPSKVIEEKLEIGQPLDFSINEKHSFQEWLQLSRIQPITRENEAVKTTEKNYS